MRLSTVSFLAAAVAPIAVSAAPVRRGADPGSVTAVQFAHVLEQLETSFYQQALAKFQPADFTNANFTSANIPIEEFTTIASDEATHTSALESLLSSFGVPPISCQFDFSSVLTSVNTMTPVARVVEMTGVAAYMGATQIIEDPAVLVAAASIMTVEARHQTILNVMQGAKAIPQAFDIALTPPEVLAIAGAFIKGPCDLGITPNAALSITNTGNVTIGTSLQFSSPAINGSTDNFSCQMLVGGLPTTISLPFNQCVVPQGINGPVAIWVTADNQPLINNPADRATQPVVAGPTITFIDTESETLGELVRNNNGNGAGAPPPLTQTISPSQATPLLSSLSSSSTSLSSSSTSLPTSLPTNSTGSNNASGSGSGSGAIANGVSMVPKPSVSPSP